MFSKRVISLFGVMAVGIGLGAWWMWRKASEPVREVPRSALELRDGRLYARGETEPFAGILFENHNSTVRKLAIQIRGGKAHGLSRGWHSNQQLEVEEHFVHGVAHGVRTRWHPNGQKRSEAHIAHGQLDGRYIEWHDNGQKAVEMTLRQGQPNGPSTAWHPTGALKARVRHQQGVIIERELLPDSATNGTARVTATQ